jgi:hypothetical protein
MQINFNVIADMSEVTDIISGNQPFHHQISLTITNFPTPIFWVLCNHGNSSTAK